MQGKILLVIGILLVAFAALTFVFGGFPEERNAIQVGEASFGFTETRTIPEWAAWGSLIVGIVLATVGFTSKK